MKISIETKVATGFIISLLIIAAFSINTYYSMHSLVGAHKKHQQTLQMLESIHSIRLNIAKTESSCRGYALSGSEKSLKRFYGFKNEADGLFDSLGKMLSQEQISILDQDHVSETYKNLISFENNVVELKQRNETDNIISLFKTGRSSDYIAAIFASLEQIEHLQNASIVDFTQKNSQAINVTKRSVLFLVISIIFILGIVYYLFKCDVTESKRAKLDLRKANEDLESIIESRTKTLINSEKKYRLLADNVIDVISLHKMDGTYSYVSESCKNILGYEPEEMIGRTGFDFMHPDDEGKVRSIHSNLFSSHKNTDVISFRFLSKSGEYIWVESLAKTVVNEAGEFEGIVICTRDITARVEAEKAFKEHDRMLKSIMDNSGNPIFIKNLDGEYLLANKQFEIMAKELQGNIEGSVKGMKMQDLVSNEIVLKENKRDEIVVETGNVLEYELQYEVEGEQKTFAVSKFPIRDDNNKIYAICAIGTNVTSYKKVKKEILDSKAKLKAIIQNSIDPIWSIDKNLKLMDFNYSCRSMISFLYGKEIYTSMNTLDLNDPDSATEWEGYYKRSLGGEFFSKEIKAIRNMEDYYYDISFNPIVVNESVEGVAVFARDITSHKKTEKQLKYKVNELNTFMYKATHDLRSPLVSLMGLVNITEQENDIHEVKSYFGMIKKSVSKMDNLLVDLVNITNVSQGQLTVNKVNFGNMAGEIIDSLKHYPNFENIQIIKKIDCEVPFYGDDKLLYSVMQNLIDNAIKYSRSGSSSAPQVSFSVTTDENSATIAISDNGIGIPEGSVEKVFDMFYRATSLSSGTGLGLYIVKTGVEKMKGKITLSSKENTGTTIFITLPNNYVEKKAITAVRSVA